MSMDFLKSLNEAKLHSRMHFEGLDISVEVPAGGYRRGVNKKTGEPWAQKISANYGYIKGTHSPDGEHLDCYLRKSPKAFARVYVMHQMTVDGSRFDEDKVMLGYSSKAEAIAAFKDVTFKPSTMYGGCTEFDMEHFQVIAFSASKSHAMLTDNKTFDEFRKKGLLGNSIKSPVQVAKKVSESLALGLSEIGETLERGDIEECLDWSGLHEGVELETALRRAYGHYTSTPYMLELSELSEDVFRANVLNYIMEQDALATDVEDQFAELSEEISTDYDNDFMPVAEIEESLEELEEEPVMEANNYAVVMTTQIMENIGTAENPSWATAGTRVELVQEGFTHYGDARALAARVAAGKHEVTITEGAYVLGIDVMPTGEYRQFHEAVEEDEPVAEDTTEDVFFQQQVMEVQKLAGVQQGTYENKGTPSVHETRARLAALSEGFSEAAQAEDIENEATVALPSRAELAQAVRLVRETIKKNPKADVFKVIRAVCHKHYAGRPSFEDAIIADIQSEFGTTHAFQRLVLDGHEVAPRTVTKVIDKR